eukprot:GHRR01005689.1.p1 GENE.GHRR01005689.1~~GHRR01005689.1.p1  ORF type:complete len:594 (+),score=268.38 GHRR01005689.1:244-1782(+)
MAIRGALPIKADSTNSKQPLVDSGLVAEVSNIDLRVRNMYSGLLDASLEVNGSLTAPQLGGVVVFSRGTAYLVPPAAAGTGSTAEAQEAAAAAASASQLGQADMVKRAFSALKAGRARAVLDQRQQVAKQPAAPAASQPLAPFLLPPGPHNTEPATDLSSDSAASTPTAAGSQAAAAEPEAPALLLCGLELVLGPELRAVFPVVLNVGVSGRLVLNGNPAQPDGLVPSGTIRLEGGVLNLVATQFRLDRDHTNTISFTPDAGLDPILDFALNSSELRVAINGRGSSWQDHLTISATGPAGAAGTAAGGVGTAAGVGIGAGAAAGSASGRDPGLVGLEGLVGDPLGGRAVARVFEGRLAEALLAEDGSFSLATLAGNTLGSLLPKIETQGQLGRARWRLVSAPSLPGLLSSAEPPAGRPESTSPPSDAGPRLLRSLALGTEVELALGRSLVAALSHNMPAAATDGGEAGTEVRLSMALSRQLRLLVQQRGLRLAPSVLLQYSSEGTPGLTAQT